MADSLVEELKLALGNAYTIERELSGGGMSRVFVAREHALGREVVIKVLPPDLAAGVNRDRFRQEVQLAARLSHPYIVPLLHAGEHGSLLWFTMPYIDGDSLRTRLQREGALKLPEVLRLLHDVVEALAYAHSRGVIHRDIKPANILSDGQHALVTDFGVAKALNAALPMGGAGHTTSGMAIGTPAYMAPEQLAADPDADQRVDIYALGLLAYELLTGDSPFAAASPTATMTAQLTRMPEPLHQLQADIPQAFSDLVQRCLAKAPDDRPPNAQTVLLELDRISGALMADAHRSTSGETARQSHASALPLVLATAGVVALVATGFWWTGRHSAQSVARDTAAVHVAGDTGDQGTTLPVRPLTHQDSVNIAAALREQLNQLEPKSTRTRDTVVMIDTVPLAIGLAQTDSLIRAQVQLMYNQRRDNALPSTSPITVPTAPNAALTPAVPILPAPFGTHRLGIVVTEGRNSDTTGHGLALALANELARRARGQNAWATVTIDSTMRRPGQPNGPNDPDVLAFVGVRRDAGDSTRATFFVFNPAHNAQDQPIWVTSDPVLHPTSPAQFGRAVRDAGRDLQMVGALPPGVPWPKRNEGAGRPSGPSDAGPQQFRGPINHRIDSLRGVADSIRRNHGKQPDSP